MEDNLRKISHLRDEVWLTSHYILCGRCLCFGKTDTKVKNIAAFYSNGIPEFPNLLSFQMYCGDSQLSRPILNLWY